MTGRGQDKDKIRTRQEQNPGKTRQTRNVTRNDR
jgi:hypothetical protein